MKLLNNILHIEFADFITAGWKEDSIKKANFRNGPFWQMVPDTQDKRKVLVQYDTLRPKDQEKLTAQFGNPYEYIAKEPIKKLIVSDPKAEIFFKDYRYDDNKVLPFEHQQRYTKTAAFLNLLNKLNEDKRIIKKDLNLSLEKFWLAVCDIIKSDAYELPASYHRLLAKLKEYEDKSYECVIDWRFGNKNTAKIGKGETGFDADLYNKQIAFIRKAASMHQNFDAMQITSAVNVLFEKQGWPIISHATVYNVCKENSHLTTAGSRGKREFQNTISMQHMRKRPEFPLYYFTLDGWTAELLYQENGTYHNRMVVVIILDAMNNYPIGYAIGDRENTELIRQANRNAAQHINELFGGNFQPRQMQSDNYGIKNLTPFYQAMAHLHTPAAVGNAKAKVIEPYFKYINKTYCQRFPNWSGFNLNSKKSNQPNVEFLNKIKHSFPDKAGVITQIEMMIAQERKIKIEAYQQAWAKMPDSEKLTMKKEDMLMVYGRQTNYTHTITGQGLQVTIGGQKLTYDSFDPAFRALQHQRFSIVYDDADLTSILAITEDQKRRFVLEAKRAIPMDLHSMTTEDHDYRNRINQFNETRMQEVIDTYVNDNALIDEVISNTVLNLNDYNEASLKLMFTSPTGQQKEGLQDAKGLKKVKDQAQRAIAVEAKQEAKNWQQQQQDYLQTKTDINAYLD